VEQSGPARSCTTLRSDSLDALLSGHFGCGVQCCQDTIFRPEQLFEHRGSGTKNAVRNQILLELFGGGRAHTGCFKNIRELDNRGCFTQKRPPKACWFNGRERRSGVCQRGSRNNSQNSAIYSEKAPRRSRMRFKRVLTDCLRTPSVSAI